jgi:hypothetical protein
MFVDLFLIYQFIKRLTTPFNEWDAFKLGIIDAKGNVLRKRNTLLTNDEKRAFGAYDLMILNIKKLLERIPGGQSKFSSYAAALFLIKEWNHFTEDSLLTESVSDSLITDSLDSLFVLLDKSNYIKNEEFVNQKNHPFENYFEEDVPTNNVGSGNIAGLGVGDQGEPGLTLKQMNNYKRKKKILKRFSQFKEDLEDDEIKAKRKVLYKKHTIQTKPATVGTIRGT